MNKGFISPVELLTTLFALILDVVSFIFTITALDLLLVPSLLLTMGGFFITALMFVTTGKLMKKSKSKEMVKKIGKKIIKKFGLSFLIEMIPIIGGIIPVWTISVYSHFKAVKGAE